jgi:hypothetical protein
MRTTHLVYEKRNPNSQAYVPSSFKEMVTDRWGDIYSFSQISGRPPQTTRTSPTPRSSLQREPREASDRVRGNDSIHNHITPKVSPVQT